MLFQKLECSSLFRSGSPIATGLFNREVLDPEHKLFEGRNVNEYFSVPPDGARLDMRQSLYGRITSISTKALPFAA